MSDNILRITVRVPMTTREMRKAPYKAAAQARKAANGRKVHRFTTGGTFNVTPGVYEYRASYVMGDDQ